MTRATVGGSAAQLTTDPRSRARRKRRAEIVNARQLGIPHHLSVQLRLMRHRLHLQRARARPRGHSAARLAACSRCLPPLALIPRSRLQAPASPSLGPTRCAGPSRCACRRRRRAEGSWGLQRGVEAPPPGSRSNSLSIPHAPHRTRPRTAGHPSLSLLPPGCRLCPVARLRMSTSPHAFAAPSHVCLHHSAGRPPTHPHPLHSAR
eukprot:1509606-Prymnesium_polylepis.2